MKSIVEVVKQRYPFLKDQIETTVNEDEEFSKVNFQHPKYHLWFSQEGDNFIVGINSLHTHFDLGSFDSNLEDALEEIDDIVNDRIVAIGLKEKSEDYVLATMERDAGLKAYQQEKPRVEIVSFRREY